MTTDNTTELLARWEARALNAAPVDSMIVNRHIRELREALAAAPAQPVALPAGMPEPVAFLSIDCIDERYLCFTKPNDGDPLQALYTADQVQAMLAQGLKHVCNLWVDPETKRFVVDRCDHPLDQLVPAYIAAAHQTPAAVERKPLTLGQIGDAVRAAHIAFCLDKFPTFEHAIVHFTEQAHGIAAQQGDKT